MHTSSSTPVDTSLRIEPHSKTQGTSRETAHGAISKDVADTMAEVRGDAAHAGTQSQARKFAPKDVEIQPGGGIPQWGSAYEAAKTLDKDDIKEMFASCAVIPGHENPGLVSRAAASVGMAPKARKKAAEHDAVIANARQSYGQAMKATDTQLRESGRRAGSIKWRHALLADLIGLIPTFTVALMRTIDKSPMPSTTPSQAAMHAFDPSPLALPTSITGLAGQFATNVFSPAYTTKTLMELLPVQAALRHGMAKGFNDKGNLNEHSFNLLKAWWNSNEAGGMDKLEAAFEDFEAALRQHKSFYGNMAHENWPRILRAGLNMAFSEASMKISNEHPDWGPKVGSWLIVAGQTFSLGLMIYLSAKIGGPNQDYGIQDTAVSNDLHRAIPRMAQDLVLRQTGERIPYGQDLADAVRGVEVDDQALADVESLFEHQVVARVNLAVRDFQEEKLDLIEQIGDALGMTLPQVQERMELLNSDVVPVAAGTPPPPEEAGDEAAEAHRSGVRLQELNDVFERGLTEGSRPQAEVMETLQALGHQINAINVDLEHLQAGGDRWNQMSDAHKAVVTRRVNPSMAEIKEGAKELGRGKFWNTFMTRAAAHLVQKYSKPIQGAFAASSNGLQLINGFFGIQSAIGKPVQYATRAATVGAHFVMFSIFDIAGGGPLVSWKNDLWGLLDKMVDWRPLGVPVFGPTRLTSPLTYLTMVPKTIALTGLIGWGSLILPREIFRVATAGTANSLARRVLAKGRPPQPIAAPETERDDIEIPNRRRQHAAGSLLTPSN